MRVNRSWKVSLIGLIILIAAIILIGTPKVVAEAFPPFAGSALNSDAELIPLDEVIDQIKAFDEEADAMMVNEPEGTVLKVYWSDNREKPIVLELISVSDNDFLCRGEDVRSMLADALNKH